MTSIIGINNNLMASSVANTLKAHYSNLGDSTQRLSSGLRVNSAADDAAGLAIRELQRADIAALAQGARNANDAISMLQVFDGALTVIDEKLIRMKELAEQAATGTYDSTQRLMIDSEFQAMGSEIDRIARATDFNGIKLLDGIYSPTKVIQVQVGTKTESWATANSANVVNVVAKDNEADEPVPPTIDAVSANLTPTKYNKYLPTAPNGPVQATQPVTLTIQTRETRTETKGNDFNYVLAAIDNDAIAAIPGDFIFEYIEDYDGSKRWTIINPNRVELTPDTLSATRVAYGGDLNGNPPYPPGLDAGPDINVTLRNVTYNGQAANLDNLYDYDRTVGLVLSKNGTTYKRTRVVYNITSSMGTATYDEVNKSITVNLGNGDKVVLDCELSKATKNGQQITFDLQIDGTAKSKEVPIYENRVVPVDNEDGIPDTLVRIHFGTGNDQKEDYYDINKMAATREALGLKDVDVQTQENAQKTLVKMNDAIVAKDKIRANYGALQNRLENTVTNNMTQMEMLQASESRISDADIATEMMEFVRAQVLTNSAVAMLAQANSMPQMIMRLIGG